MSRGEFRTLLVEGDVQGLRGLWEVAMPHLPQPKSYAEAEKVMHITRTQAASIPLRPRAYSHRWLTERNLPSHLPDELRPKAERMFPIVVEGVGIFVRPTTNEYLKPAMLEVQTSMEHAVADAYAEGRTDPDFVKAQMAAAKDRAMKALFGRPKQ